MNRILFDQNAQARSTNFQSLSQRLRAIARRLTFIGTVAAAASCGVGVGPGDETSETPDDSVAEAQQAATVSPIGTAVKFHPGHYYHIPAQNPETIIANNEFATTSALRGAQVRYYWQQLEPSVDTYDFTLIEQHLAALQAKGERLVILLQTKSFGADDHVVPNYMKTAGYDGGEFAYGAWDDTTDTVKGYNLSLWNSGVRWRLTRLINKLGARFNNEPYFEGVGLVETAVGTPIGSPPNYNESKFYGNLLTVNKSMKAAFPNTMTFQFLNYPPGILENFIAGPSGLQSFAGGLGGPDVWLQDPGVNDAGRVYSYYEEFKHVIPLSPSIMPGNYRNTRHDNTGYQPTLTELVSFARNKLHANYLFWTRISKAGDPGYFTTVLEELNKPAQKVNAAGGLDTTCPSRYPSCYRN